MAQGSVALPAGYSLEQNLPEGYSLDHEAAQSAPKPAYAAGSIAPKLDTPIHATEYGLKEFGGGLADVGKSIWGLMKPPEGRAETAASAVGPEGLIPYRMGKGLVDLGRQAAQVPGAIKDLAQSPDPLGTLALVAPRAGGQAAGQLMAAEGPKVASDIPFSRINLKAGAKAVMGDIPGVRKVGAFFEDPMKSATRDAIKEGVAAKIPTSGPRSVGAGAQSAEPGSAPRQSGGTSTPKARLVLTPEEAQAQAQMQRIAETRASERGMQHAGGMKPAPGKISMGPGAASAADPATMGSGGYSPAPGEGETDLDMAMRRPIMQPNDVGPTNRVPGSERASSVIPREELMEAGKHGRTEAA